MDIRDHRDLLVWQRAVDLAVECYRITKHFPRSEDYGLTRQIRRAAVSVAANIAEGNARGSIREYAHHVSIARGSTREVETHLVIAARIGLSTTERLDPIFQRLDELSRMLNALRRSLIRSSR